jgi:hypothetical protein
VRDQDLPGLLRAARVTGRRPTLSRDFVEIRAEFSEFLGFFGRILGFLAEFLRIFSWPDHDSYLTQVLEIIGLSEFERRFASGFVLSKTLFSAFESGSSIILPNIGTRALVTLAFTKRLERPPSDRPDKSQYSRDRAACDQENPV